MTQSEPRILVIGAGPAGLAAAVSAAEAGVRVLLVDEASGPGGQYLAGKPQHRAFQTQAERDGARLVGRLRELSRAGQVDVCCGATVWSLDASLTAMIAQGGAGRSAAAARVQAGAVVLAAGARETVVPFPGWTLPGVMTVGAAQLLAKRHNVVPLAVRQPSGASRPRVLLAGSGLLLLPAAAMLAELGARVVGVLETARPSVELLRRVGKAGRIGSLAPSLWTRRDEAWHYLSALHRHRIPYLFGRSVVRAIASVEGRLGTVDVARLRREGLPHAGVGRDLAGRFAVRQSRPCPERGVGSTRGRGGHPRCRARRMGRRRRRAIARADKHPGPVRRG